MYWFTYPFCWNTCTPVTTPLVYSNDMSVTQQIAHLFGLFEQYQGELDNYVSKEDFDGFLEWLAGEEDAQTQALQSYTDQTAQELRELIAQLTKSELAWNVQHGIFTSSEDAMRDMFNDLSIYGLTVDEVIELGLTVDDIANSKLTVRGFALYSGIYYKGDDYISPGIFKEE